MSGNTHIIGLLLALSLFGCDARQIPTPKEAELYPGGATSVAGKPIASFMRVADNMPQAQRPDFYAGKALAKQPWVKAPTITTARDGLGPIHNARSCIACHKNGGRGKLPEDSSEPLFSAFVRISIPGSDLIHGSIPEPVYGDQLQTQSVALSHQLQQQTQIDEVPPEAKLTISWQQESYTYPDNTTIELRRPQLNIKQLGYGPLHKDTLLSLRNSPPIHGMGLLELIPQQTLDRLADPNDRDNNGISGRVNQVWDVEQQKTVPGRFGLKANRPNNLRIVTAAAFAGDVGISNPLFPKQPCTAAQTLCNTTPNGNDAEGVELPMHLLELTSNFTRNLAVPKRRNADKPEVQAGRTLFYRSDCQQCHTPSFVTETSKNQPHLSRQTIWPYSDLLLHDMGPALADGRPDYLANGSEWRTPPLWGIGMTKAVNGSQHLLHDGRARTVEEAILWHGGEAEQSRNLFTQLNADERQQLIQFVESL